jgi:hypothetical protein
MTIYRGGVEDVAIVDEIVVELNPGGPTVWRARVDSLKLVVQGDSPAQAEAAALAAVIKAGARVSDDVIVRVRFGTRAARLAAGWVPPRARSARR